jgi:type IV pilus assembly protein PilO
MALLVGFNVFVAAALIYMTVRGASALPDEFNALHHQALNRRSAVLAPSVVDERVKQAREQIAKFYEDRFPNSSAAIFEALGKLATENHVRLNQASYSVTDSDMTGLRDVVIVANLNGDYAQSMKFINALEREKMFFIVDNVDLGEQSAGGQLKLTIRIATYMRGEA